MNKLDDCQFAYIQSKVIIHHLHLTYQLTPHLCRWAYHQEPEGRHDLGFQFGVLVSLDNSDTDRQAILTPSG